MLVHLLDVTRTMASRNLLALRAELGEQTKEIQKLQKEVEKATQNTINQLSKSKREQYYKPSTTNSHNVSREPVTSSSQRGNLSLFSSVPLQDLLLQSSQCIGQAVDPEETSLPKTCSLMQNPSAGTSCPPDIHSDKTNLNDWSWFKDSQRRLQQISHLQGLQQLHAQQPASAIHLKLQELIRQNAAEVEMRPKGSISQEENKLDAKVQELETTNVIQEEMLKQAQVYTQLLKEKLQKRDQILQDTQKAILIYNEQSNKKVQGNFDLSNLGLIVVETLQELTDEVSSLKGQIQPAEDEINFLKGELKDKAACLKKLQESNDNLANEKEQQRALLVAEMNAVRSQSECIQTQLASSEDQNAKDAEHRANLESKVSQLQCDLQNSKRANEDKVQELKTQLSSVNEALEELQNEHARHKQESAGQHLQLNEALKTCEKQLNLEKEHNRQLQDREMVNCLTNENLRSEVIERRMEVERLQAVVNIVKEESRKKSEQQLRTIREKTASLNSTSSRLEAIEDALQKTSKELAAKSQHLDHAEKSLIETRNLLAEKDKSLQSVADELKKLRLYAESKKREVQQMRADNERTAEMQRDAETLKLLLVEKDNMIVTLRGQTEAMTQMIGQQNQKVEALEAEKSQLLDRAADKKAEIRDLALKAEKKEKRIAELEEFCTNLELEKRKLDNANTKKILAAKHMKKDREQIVAELRETQRDLANLAEDYESLKTEYENQRGDKENTTTRLKMQLKAAIAELEQTKNTLNTVEDCDGHAVKIATRMQKKITAKREQIDMLQSRVHFLEEALSIATKTLLQLAERQAVIQLLEQDTMRLKLQHTLNLQELRGPVADSLGKLPHQRTAMSMLHSAEFSHPQSKMQMHFCEATNISEDNVAKPLEAVIHLPDRLSLSKAEEARKTANCTSDQVSKEPITLPTADLEDDVSTLSIGHTVTPCHVWSLEKHVHKEDVNPRSPVHCLLTTPTTEIDIDGKFYSPNKDRELVLVSGESVAGFVRNTYQNLQHRLECLQIIATDLQTKNKEMASIFGTEDEKMFQ
ncbi:coiled-coil domain-containing protein 158 isoform X3 [Eleutherodactylus coqui]|uniref:coiled-coil domain-containing protein 158 isoform X3 n=1 Tax=Eleutherodactylus coqui TaxID=57060 RepID=UPI003461BC19